MVGGLRSRRPQVRILSGAPLRQALCLQEKGLTSTTAGGRNFWCAWSRSSSDRYEHDGEQGGDETLVSRVDVDRPAVARCGRCSLVVRPTVGGIRHHLAGPEPAGILEPPVLGPWELRADRDLRDQDGGLPGGPVVRHTDDEHTPPQADPGQNLARRRTEILFTTGCHLLALQHRRPDRAARIGRRLEQRRGVRRGARNRPRLRLSDNCQELRLGTDSSCRAACQSR